MHRRHKSVVLNKPMVAVGGVMGGAIGMDTCGPICMGVGVGVGMRGGNAVAKLYSNVRKQRHVVRL